MIPYLSYHQDIPVRIIRNRRLLTKAALYIAFLVVPFVLQFAAQRTDPNGKMFLVYLFGGLALVFGFLGYFAYRQFFSVPVQLEPCPYCGDFLGMNLVVVWWPIYGLSACGTCAHDFETPFEPKDARPGSFETPPKAHGLQGK